MMLFQPELGLSVLDLLGRSADSVRWTPLQKQETKRIDGGLPLPLRCLSQFFRGKRRSTAYGMNFLCVSLHTFHIWGGFVFIIDDHDNFHSWMMTLNSIFPYWRMIRYSSH